MREPPVGRFFSKSGKIAIKTDKNALQKAAESEKSTLKPSI
ncbi:MAG: hypothetical protein RL370_981 [Actinomycetota bacterium]|jgi:hypothetical protein